MILDGHEIIPRTLKVRNKKYKFYYLNDLKKKGLGDIDKLPFSIKVLLEAALRQYDGQSITQEHILNLSRYSEGYGMGKEVPFKPSRIVLQDFTGVPAIVDLAAMRSAMARAGKDPNKINPTIPVDLVVDHSVMVDYFGTEDALEKNVTAEFRRNEERYRFLKWAKNSFDSFNVIPPSVGIIHQVNLERLATLVMTKETEEGTMIYPDTLLGTDSHTTMINGIGVLGWGVGGIEAEACMLSQPLYFVTPEVIGVELKGELNEGVTATDLVLRITQLLREVDVVGKFVEFYGDGLDQLSLADRATIANMAPEYGATMGYFPVDEETLRYMKNTGRDDELIEAIKVYYTRQGMFRTKETSEMVEYSFEVSLDMGTVSPSLAGPKRSQDRIKLEDMQSKFIKVLKTPIIEDGFGVDEGEIENSYPIKWEDGTEESLKEGAVVIAAITSCTNTSNPSVMIGAGLMAKKAKKMGLKKPRYVKTSLTPGSRVVTKYLEESGLLPYLEALGFNVAGYGCATCIGNSGPLPSAVKDGVVENDLIVASVISGNRNFEGRVHPHVKANYLASPMLVIAYALAGTVNINLTTDPIGYNDANKGIYLKDIWPTSMEIKGVIKGVMRANLYINEYKSIYENHPKWDSIPLDAGNLYNWNQESSYIQEPPFFMDLGPDKRDILPIENCRVLALLGDSVTTDHISPAGSIPPDSPAARYLEAHQVTIEDFNSYGSRRGNHEVMMRGTLANIRIRNQLAKGKEGGYTSYLKSDEVMPIYDAAMKYHGDKTPLIIIAGKEYGTGSSRDWAAKGTNLLGVKVVIANSYERIHRSNLIGMGVMPLQFMGGQSRESLNLDGTETFHILGLSNDIEPLDRLPVIARHPSGKETSFSVVLRFDSDAEIDYYRHGGILHKILREWIQED